MDHQDWKTVVIGKKPKPELLVKQSTRPNKFQRNLENDDPDMRLKKTFNVRDIQQFRTHGNLTQKQLAMLLNCTAGDVKMWEGGTLTPAPVVIKKMKNIGIGSKPTSK